VKAVNSNEMNAYLQSLTVRLSSSTRPTLFTLTFSIASL